MIPKKVLFCTDFSENSAHARQYAVEYAQAFEAGLILLHVINTSQIGYPSVEGKSVPFDIRTAIDGIQEKDLRSYFIYKREQGISSRSMARKTSSIKNFYRYLQRQEKVTSNPTDLLEAPKAGAALPKTLSLYEVERFLGIHTA